MLLVNAYGADDNIVCSKGEKKMPSSEIFFFFNLVLQHHYAF